jgi:hypothetical protein
VKNSRPRIKYSQTPHSISRRIETIPNKTASALLSLINRKTVGFGQGFVDLSYRQISTELGVHSRTLTKAAKLLESWGDILRERVANRVYRWKIILQQDEIIEDPSQTYATREPEVDRSVLIDRSGPCGSIDQDQPDRSIRIKDADIENVRVDETKAPDATSEQLEAPLKKLLKETDLKKQQQAGIELEEFACETSKDTQPKLAPRSGDDEPLHKFCLRGLKSYGVSQRVARQLCREYEHETIQRVLDTVPGMTGIKNLAGYLVAAIKDGGYEMKSHSAGGKKNAHQVTGGRSNYAHLTDDNVKAGRHRNVKDTGDAPIVYRTVQETKLENDRLEAERVEREESYQEQGQTLAQRFQTLSGNVKERLKLQAASYLETLVPTSAKREEMLRDQAFRRVANRTVLERFFEWVDSGFSSEQALERLALV